MPAISDLIMPKLGLTMTEGTIDEWALAPGDSFSSGDLVLVVETDKIANEIEAPADGTLHEIIVPVGETVPVGTVLARWDVGATAPAATHPPDAANNGEPSEVTAAEPAATAVVGGAGGGARVVATPLARRIADQERVDLHTVSGTGPKGRIKAEDVRKATLVAPAISEQPEPAGPPMAGTRLTPTAYQSAVAKRLTEAKRDTPHFYLSTEANVGALLDRRQRLNAENADLRISINHLIIAAVGKALGDIPQANRVWADGEILQFDTTDVGVAVTTNDGLFVPILRDIAPRGLGSVASSARDIVTRARDRALSQQDMTGGAITVSNAGMFDVTYMGSIINPGQSSILGVGSIRKIFRPDDEGRPVLCQEMGLVLSCDHRIFDGVGGLAFLNGIKDYLETPCKLLA
ncbi:MAG: 2-oxo acid dehydrogenase subunit E2 [Gammaproteobacteria bacterium]|nr:MAG: 2-oxo acid dehydrogenase subunit E2 [Gammaproteobacteria bacterium]RLA61696.1 MAG: 2-oxo acid dehydrogenase subunit E2 [Gammaproteobacteria bacterium]